MNNVQLFSNPKFGDIRVVEIEGKPYFVANDVARILNYSNPRDAVLKHCKPDGVAKCDIIDSLGRNQPMSVLNEPNFYRLVMRSDMPDAEKFQDWVCEDVIPSIRKHGGYMTPQTIDNLIADPANGIKLLQALQSEREAKDRIAAEKEEIEAKLIELKPTVEYAERVLNDKKNTLLTNQIAKEFGMSDKVLNAVLRDLGVQYKQNNQWLLSRKYADKGYTDTRTTSGQTEDSSWTSVSTVWFQAGRRFIHDIIDPLLNSRDLIFAKGKWFLYGSAIEVNKNNKKIKHIA